MKLRHSGSLFRLALGSLLLFIFFAFACAQEYQRPPGPGFREFRPHEDTLPPGTNRPPAQVPEASPTLTKGGSIIISVEAKTQHAESMIVVQASGLRPGDWLNRDNLQQAIRRIFASGLFTDVAADTTMVADGVKLVFRVTEAPRLKAVHFLGNHKVATKDLSGKVAAKEGEVLSAQKVFDWTQEVSDLYKEKGFVLAKVSTGRAPPDNAGRVDLNFFIEEGDKIRVRKVTYSGNNAVSAKNLTRKIANKPYSWPWHTTGFRDEEFKKDLERLTDYYKELGYLNAKVLNYDLKYDKGWTDISLSLSEGMKFYLGEITFKGESVFTQTDLTRELKAAPGAVYNQKKVQQSLTNIYGVYSEQGYIYAQVVPVDSIRGDTVDLQFRITENLPAKIRLVSIEGNDRTIEKVIRREVVSMPGSIFRRSEVIRSQQNIFNLGFFEDVQLDYRKVDTTTDIDLTYKVKEKFAGTVGAGVSYSGTDGLVGYVELSQPNMFGRADRLYTKVEWGVQKKNYELGFTEPWLFDTPTSAGVNLFYLTHTYDYYDKRDRGGEVSVSRPLPLDFTRGYFTFHAGDALISGSTRPDIANDSSPKMTVSTTFRFDRDSRDYIFNPASGSFNSYSFTLAGGPLGGDVRFQKHILESNFFYPLFWKFALRFRARLGYVAGFGPSGDTAAPSVPIYERFFPGGTGEDGVRGYPDRSLGVIRGGYNEGGNTEAIFSVEYRLRFNRSLVALAFLDAGDAWASFRDVNLAGLKRGAGVGVRLEIPMLGWLGFDLGYGFDRRDGPKLEPHFQLGASYSPTGF